MKNLIWQKFRFYYFNSKHYLKEKIVCKTIIFSLLVIWLVNFFNNYNPYLLLFIFFFVFLFFYYKINWWNILLLIFLAIIFGIISHYFFTDLKKNYLIYIFQKVWGNNSLQNILVNFNKKNYELQTAKLINMLILNYQDYQSEIFHNFKNLGIVHLITISGLHIHLIYKFINWIFKFNKYLNIALPNLFIVFYFIAINFSYSCLRVLLLVFISKLLNNKNKIYHWAWVSIISFIFNFQIYTSISFALSYGISLIIYLFNIKFWKNDFIKWLLLNLTIFYFVNLIILNFSKKIQIFMILNNYIFAPIIIAYYFYFLFTFILIFLYEVQNFLTSLFLNFYSSLKINEINININWWTLDFSYIGFVIFIVIISLVIYWDGVYFNQKKI